MTDAPPAAPLVPDVHAIPRKIAVEGKVNLIGLTRDGMRAALIGAGTPERQAKMRVGQIWQWIYHWGVRDFALMTNLAKEYRLLLAENFTISLPEVVTRQISADGTRKYLVRIMGGHEVEVVYIPEDSRGTLCISSQVGCTLTCSFCHTGTLRLEYDIEAGPRGVLLGNGLRPFPVDGIGEGVDGDAEILALGDPEFAPPPRVARHDDDPAPAV